MVDLRELASFIRCAQDGLSPDQLETAIRLQFPDVTAEEISWGIDQALDDLLGDIAMNKALIGNAADLITMTDDSPE